MNVLVTGSNGFIAKNLIVGLKNLNCNVVIFDKKNNSEQLKNKIILSVHGQFKSCQFGRSV